MNARKLCAIVLLVVLGGARVAADPLAACKPSEPCHLRMREDTTLTKDDGTQYRLPPGHFYDVPTWTGLNDEVIRLQNQETRLKSENQSLRGSLAGWQPGWLTVMVAITFGVGIGVGGYYYYEHK